MGGVFALGAVHAQGNAALDGINKMQGTSHQQIDAPKGKGESKGTPQAA